MLDCNNKTQDRRKVIADRLEPDLTPAEIGRRLGLSERWVRQIAFACGLTRLARPEERLLNPRQVCILAFQDFTTRHLYPPTAREIVEGCGLSSTSVALYNLVVLGQRGISRGLVMSPGALC